MSAIPANAEEITVDWLNQVLAAAKGFGGEHVSDFEIEPVGAELGYLGYLYRLKLQYENDSATAPGTLIAKLPSDDPANRMTGNAIRAYERESVFYDRCGESSPLNPPSAYYSYADPDADEYIILMEDLGHCRFVNQVDGATRDDALRCFESLARHHASFWNDNERLKWAPAYAEYGTLYAPLLAPGAALLQEHWSDVMEDVYLENQDKALSSYARIANELQKSPATLIHCDPRIENVAFEPDGAPRFYDWQLSARGPAAYDLMYFLKMSMDADDRRACQDELFDTYLSTLSEQGVSYPRDQLMDDMSLACCTIWSFMAMVGNFFFRNELNERVFNMTMPRYLGMIEDFGAVEKLQSLD